MAWMAVVAVAVGLLGLLAVGYLLVTVLASGGADRAVLPSHYDPQRYARGGRAMHPAPDRVGICEDCGVWTDPDESFCLICTGVVREVVRDEHDRPPSGSRTAPRRR